MLSNFPGFAIGSASQRNVPTRKAWSLSLASPCAGVLGLWHSLFVRFRTLRVRSSQLLCISISFRIFAFPDITADGSSTLGAALAAMLLVHNVSPVLATSAAFAGGFLAGTLTGTLATKFKINGLLAGILVMTGLYSINL